VTPRAQLIIIIYYYTPVSKTVACLIFYNLKKLEPIFVIFGKLYIKGPSF